MAKKNMNRRKLVIILLIIFFVIILISSVLFIIYAFNGNYITYSNEIALTDDDKVDATNSSAIIVNGMLVGAAKKDAWISATKYYEKYKNAESIDVDLFSENRMYGTYKTASLKLFNKTNVYTTIAKENVPQKYLATSSAEGSRVLAGMTKLDATDVDKKYVKEALGSYKLLNSSIKISEVYVTCINDVSDRIITAVSAKPSLFGVYSAVIYVTGEKATLIKYSFVRDRDNANKWPVYSLEFVKDLNEDGVPEIILQELTNKDVTYSVLELKNKIFYQVLKVTVQI